MSPETNHPAGPPGSSDYSSLSEAKFDDVAAKRRLWAAIKLLAVFCAVYFIAAMIATPEFANVARIEIVGLPVAFYTGILVFLIGLVVTRMCLNQDKE